VSLDTGRIELKTLRLLFVALVAFICAGPVVAQDAGTAVTISEGNKSEFYYVNVPLEKVYPHQKGYMVLYRKSGSVLTRAYLPLTWFSESAGKAELLKLDHGTVWPYMTVYYKNGAFDHVRLFVRREMSHQSWGNFPQGTSLDAEFEAEDLKLEF